VTDDDVEELVALRIAAMKESLERIGRFDPARARERFLNSFYPEHTRFIVVDGERAGFYAFRPLVSGFHLDHLYVHPRLQGKGIGSFVLQCLIAEAEREKQPISLGALRESASNAFYQRHGFHKQSEEEWDIYYIRPYEK